MCAGDVRTTTPIIMTPQHHDELGWPRVHYSLTPRDRQNMLHSVGVMAQMMLKTGASLVMPVYDGFRSWRKGRDGEGGLEAYVKVRVSRAWGAA